MTTQIDLDNFSYEKNYLEQFDFIMENSLYLPLEFVKKSESLIDRKNTIINIDKIIDCYSISSDIEKGIFEFALNYVVANGFPQHFFVMTYNDKLDNIILNLDKTNKQIENKTLIYDVLSSKIGRAHV